MRSVMSHFTLSIDVARCPHMALAQGSVLEVLATRQDSAFLLIVWKELSNNPRLLRGRDLGGQVDDKPTLVQMERSHSKLTLVLGASVTRSTSAHSRHLLWSPIWACYARISGEGPPLVR